MRKRLLMVDDDQPVLDGLMRVLRPLRAEWEFVTAPDGPRALELIAERPFDVVMSDMRMPGMDGVELLTRVKALCPGAVRLVLSGNSEQEMLLRCVGVAHQFLAKPCDLAQLKAVLHQTGSLGDRLENEAVKAVVSRMTHLPVLPGLHQELSRALESDDCPADTVAGLLSRDPGLTATLLRLVNSAFFGLRRPVSSAREAAAFLGLETLRSILLATSLFEQIGPFAGAPFTPAQLWQHTFTVAQGARRVAALERLPRAVQDDCFTGGLLHDVGILLLASHFPEGYGEVGRLLTEEGSLLPTAEHQVFGVTHADVGAYLMALWGLPEAVVRAIAWHHVPSFEAVGEVTATGVVHAVDALCMEAEALGASRLDNLYLASLGLDQRLDAWREAVLQA